MATENSVVRALIFDLDGTLFDHEASARLALDDWLAGLDSHADELALIPGFRRQRFDVDALTEVWLELEDLHLPAWRAGEISWNEQRRRRLRDFLPQLGVRPVESELDELFAEYVALYESHWSAYPDVVACLRRAQKLGIQTAVLTNGQQAQSVAKVAATGLGALVGAVYSSEGIGVAKPEPDAYLLVCQRLGVDPADAVMVGDNYEFDVRAPRAAGLRAVHLHRQGTHRIADRTRITSLGDLALDDPRLGTVAPMTVTPQPGGGFSTRAIHAGQEADPLTGAVSVPIYQTSTYKQDGVGGLRSGYEYSRSANPTRTALEQCLAALEGGARGLAFASGLAAEDVVLRTLLKPGQHVLIPDDAYGGTYRLIARVLQPWGVQFSPVPMHDLALVAQAVQKKTAVIWVETPSNPLLNVIDIAGLAAIARVAGARLVVDNTFASPYLQQPLALGADVVVHSTTKYLGGHSDVVGGAAVTSDVGLGEQLAFHQNAIGSVAGPFDAWLVLRGAKTLAVRMDRHCDNAERIAAFLDDHSSVAQVLYPGLPQHPGHDVAARQMTRFGGMVSFRMREGANAALKVCERTRLFTLGESLGGVESLIEHPARMTHASVADSPLAVPADLIRLSVGIEDIADLLADLDEALS